MAASTPRFGGGRNAFEYVLPLLGVRQKNGSPGHPQTQGKIERFHQTLQRWLTARPPASSLAELQRQLDRFREYYNESALTARCIAEPPATPTAPPPKPSPATNRHAPGHYRLRYDRLDTTGKMSLRRAGRMHHLGVGPRARRQTRPRARRRPPHHRHRTHTGEVLSTHHIDPDPCLLAQHTTKARPLADAPKTETHVPRHVRHMSRDIT